MQQRVEFELSSEHQSAKVSVKVGEKVSFNDAGACTTSSGGVCGTVPDEFAHYLGPQTSGLVRSVRRDATGAMTSIVVRLVNGQTSQPAPAPSADVDDESGTLLSKQQLSHVAQDPGVQAALVDPSLRELLQKIDSSSQPEKMLAQALSSNPQFQEFADNVLAKVAEGAS